MNAMNTQRMIDPMPTPTGDEAQAFIVKIQRLTQFWTDGLLTDEEFQAAKAKVLGRQEPAQLLPWEYDNVVVPLD
jgi:hypothetical protein